MDYNDELDVLVSGSADFTVKIWALSAGACLNTLTGHTEWVTKVSSPSNQGVNMCWELNLERPDVEICILCCHLLQRCYSRKVK